MVEAAGVDLTASTKTETIDIRGFTADFSIYSISYSSSKASIDALNFNYNQPILPGFYQTFSYPSQNLASIQYVHRM